MFLVGGENLIDFIQDPPDGGYPAYRAVPGGSPYNVAKTLARQGVSTGYMSPFSDDTLGVLLSEHLAAEATLTLLAPASSLPTSLAVVSLTDGQASYQFYREATAERDVSAAGLLAQVPPEATGLFIGSLALTDGEDADAWVTVVEELHARGSFIALDPNIRAAFVHNREAFLARLDRVLAVADLVKLSDEDIAWLHPDRPAEEAAEAMAAQCAAGLLVLTKGGDGAVGFVAGQRVSVPVHPVAELEDTVGAGDTFMGTLIVECLMRGYVTGGALKDLSPAVAEAVLERAAKAAAINCGRVGCNPPTRAELDGI